MTPRLRPSRGALVRLRPMRTYVRARGGHDPARRRRRVLRLGRAAGRSGPARAPGGGRARRRDGGELRGQGASAFAAACTSGRRGGSVPTIVAVPSRFDAYVAASRGAVRGLQADRAGGRGPLDGGGVSRRPRARPHPRLAARGRASPARRGRATRSASPSRSASRRRRSWRRWPPRRRSLTGSPRRARRGAAFLHPLPIERRLGRGQGRRDAAANAWDRHRRGRRRGQRGRARRDPRPRPRGAAARDRGRRPVPARPLGPRDGARSAPSARSACAATRAATSSAPRCATSTGSPGACARPTGSGAP